MALRASVPSLVLSRSGRAPLRVDGLTTVIAGNFREHPLRTVDKTTAMRILVSAPRESPQVKRVSLHKIVLASNTGHSVI